jgi:hypothetical protein
MKKSDLKTLIKPLVKECINEILIEEGLLANVVSEVVKGVQGNLVMEAQAPPRRPQPSTKSKQKDTGRNEKLLGHRRKLMSAIDAEAYNGVNLFEQTEPLSSQDSSSTQSGGSVDLGRPGDSGVDISSLMNGATEIWKAMK